ncbi:hypothetical protein EW146_g6350 [Bondarzewia mesenterica]|uniref:Nucleoporin nup82 n=1 Tax=Bondarzewia mesenterica TaxID=1095465 RepID=A0A4S4LNR9_9AGAM|nr:hypothetical protein EW146_g6350 [Bondarzewia mesenterica]
MQYDEDDWSTILNNHPIFSRSSGPTDPLFDETSFELSTNTLPKFTQLDPEDDSLAPSGRRQTMVIKDAELIVAVGKELRVSALGDAKFNKGSKSYKLLHTPNIQFEIHQLALNPSGQLLAIAGAFQVAVVVLPRPGFTRLVPTKVDCKSIQVGQYYHASTSAAPIVKIEWHPWGDAGSTLMVMTVDGKLREYDISVDTEEPQQIISFVPEKKSRSFMANDVSEREVASFTLGRGKADWGPLTMYAAMKSGDVYAICPYMPQNASIPSSYIHSLECFVAAKKEYLIQSTSPDTRSLSTTYDYQHKYVSALLKQFPPGTVFPASSRSVSVHPPNTVRYPPLRQGPFLLQPSPRNLDGSEGGDATDIIYVAFSHEVEGETERLGVVLLSYQDGKVDVCLDVEKVEAQWEHKQHSNADLSPMLAVYESIDLGLVSSLSGLQLLDLLQGNHPVFHADPIYDDTVYLYHAFGVHALHLDKLLYSLATALRGEGLDSSLAASLDSQEQTEVQPIVTTFSVERRVSNPVIAVALPNDVYLTYSIFILTSSMRVVSFTLNLRSDVLQSRPADLLTDKEEIAVEPLLKQIEGPPIYVSLLGDKPFETPAIFSRPSGLPSIPRLALPGSQTPKEFRLTPDTLRYLGQTVERFTAQIHDVQLAYREVRARSALQEQEYRRQQEKSGDMEDLISQLEGPRRDKTDERLEKVQAAQSVLMSRLSKTLHALIKEASPELSEHEMGWFDELKRMKGEVIGAGRYDESSLLARVRLLEREFNRLMPHLNARREKESKRMRILYEQNQRLGVSQAFELGKQFSQEESRIRNMQRELSNLASKLEVSLGRPPSLLANPSK